MDTKPGGVCVLSCKEMLGWLNLAGAARMEVFRDGWQQLSCYSTLRFLGCEL